MATLPDLGPRRLPTPQRQVSVADLSAPSREGERLGATGTQIGLDMVEARQREADASAVFSVRRQLDDWERATLYDPQKGVVAKGGRDAFDLPEKIPQAFDEFASKLGDGVSSPRARTAVQEMIASRRDQATRFVDRHAFQQRQVYEEGQYKADIDSSLNRAALLVDAGDMATAAAEVKIAQNRTVGFMKARGRSEEEIASELRGISSKAAISTVNLLLEKDKPLEAEKFLKEAAGSMRVEDTLRAQAAVGKAVDARQGLVIASEVVDKTLRPVVQPTDFGRLSNLAEAPSQERLTELVKQAESAGKRYDKDGKLLTSSKGAQGEMQVMPGTAKDPGYGVQPAKDGSPGELARVGRDYLAAMVREFQGDVPKALAAYNAGPGAVQKAMEQAAKGRSGSVDWLSYMPEETKAYVAKITKQFGSGEGTPAMPTLGQLHEEVRNRIPVDQPQRRKIAMEEVTRQYEDTIKAKKQGDDENTARAMKWLADNGGRYSQMPAGLRANLPPKEVDNVMNFGARVAKGDDVTNPVVFQKMATDDKWLKGMTDAEFYKHSRQLSAQDAEQMALRRGKLINGESGAKGPQDLDTAGINQVLNNRLAQIGRDPTPADGKPEAQTVGAIRKFVWDQVLQQQQAAGKKFNDAEIAGVIDKLFAQNVKFQTSLLGINTGTASQRLLSMQAGDIPSDTRRALEKDFKAAGIDKPTDADYLGAYLRLKAARP